MICLVGLKSKGKKRERERERVLLVEKMAEVKGS